MNTTGRARDFDRERAAHYGRCVLFRGALGHLLSQKWRLALTHRDFRFSIGTSSRSETCTRGVEVVAGSSHLDDRFVFRIATRDLDAIRAASQISGKTVSEYVRERVVESARETVLDGIHELIGQNREAVN